MEKRCATNLGLKTGQTEGQTFCAKLPLIYFDIHCLSCAYLIVQVTALYLACRSQQRAIAQLLVASGADTNIAAKAYWGRLYSPLFWAVQNSDEQLCKTLLDAGARADIGKDLLASENISVQVRKLIEPHPSIWEKITELLKRYQFDKLSDLVKYFLPRPPPALQFLSADNSSPRALSFSILSSRSGSLAEEATMEDIR